MLCCSLALASLPCIGQGQELNARVTVNSDQIEGTNKSVFNTMQSSLTEFINDRKWTDATFAVNERIDCNFTIIVNEQDDNSFSAEIQVQARRPVYNSSYTTTLFNYRDTEFDFEYTEYEQFTYNANNLSSNLTATIIFYVYVILGMDFDSFSPLGGKTYFERAQEVVRMAQAQNSWNGWKAFESTSNRHALITALTDNASETFRNMWYTYHRRGLDEMAANPSRGRTTIIETLQSLEAFYKQRPVSLLLRIYSEAKLDEVVSIYSEATRQEKQAGYKLLSNIFPTAGSRLSSLNE